MTSAAIDLTRPSPLPLSGHLHMGGCNPAGVEVTTNSRFLTRGGRPWLPVMGEMHYSRCPAADWRTELLKMRAGGIQVVATYVFWIHHEEIRGQFDWRGQRSLRGFIESCAACGLLAFPRIGPWAHGECRNGGFPDWLLQLCGTRVRQDAPEYLACVRRLYAEIAGQLTSLLWKDGGPVIGVQVENELANNAAHLLTLKRLAREAGIDVPLYTQTGWGPAELTADELLPVFGGYPDAFWERHVDGWARSSRKHYFFSPVRDENTIGTDLLRPEKTLGPARDAQLERYPYGTCECGGGMPPAYHRRPMISPDDVAALALAKVGSGSNLQGYYMYHGGSNPEGKLTSLQESQATGYPNDLPVISYDFQAPLGEFGQVNESYHALRPLHLFLADFGERLAPLPLTLPETVPADVDDRQKLRWAARSNSRQAFLFVNNYQRLEGLPAQAAVQFQLQLHDGPLRLPSRTVDVPAGAWFFWPVNFDLDGLPLLYASAQPVCRIGTATGALYVFAAVPGIAPEFAFASGTLAAVSGTKHHRTAGGTATVVDGLAPGPGCVLDLRGTAGQQVRVLVLTGEEARRLYKAEIAGAERLLMSEASLFVDGDDVHLRSRRTADLWLAVWPAMPVSLRTGSQPPAVEPWGVFTRYVTSVPARSPHVQATRVQQATQAKPVRIGPAGVATVPDETDWAMAESWQVTVPADVLAGAAEILLVVDYVGDAARAYVGDRLVADDFHYGRAWEIGLRRFAPELLARGLTLRFLPLRRDAPVYIDEAFRPDFGDHVSVLEVRTIRVEAEYEQVLRCD